MSPTARWVVPGYIVSCLVLGGSSAGGYIANGLLQLLAIALIAWSRLAHSDRPLQRSEGALLTLLGALVLVILIQFIPLPRTLWEALPGRNALLEPLDAAGIAFSHGFVSLIPHESIKSALWLLPPIGVLLAMVRIPGACAGRRLALALVGTMCLAVVVGAMQKAGGSASALYFYRITNNGFAVGFFANVNHMASLLLVTIPFQAALLRDALAKRGNARAPLLGGIAASLAVTVVGIVVVGSLAGYGLLLPVGVASALIVRGRRRTRAAAALLIGPAVLAGMAFILLSHEGQTLLDQGSAMSAGSRQVIFATTWHAIRDFWPMGSGLGTFAEVYPLYENPFDVMRSFINHAHNEYLELMLELGVAGVLLLGTFLMWWSARAWHIWRDSLSSPFAQAAVIATATLLVHSLVDYPLRTAALSTVFAACVSLMVAPASRRLNAATPPDIRVRLAEKGAYFEK